MELKAARRLLEQYRAAGGTVDDNVDDELGLCGGGGGRKQSAKAAAADARPPQRRAREKYEKNAAAHGDTAFERFQQRLGRSPSQVLRLAWSCRRTVSPAIATLVFTLTPSGLCPGTPMEGHHCD